ncbi:nuclear pore complex protein Nup160-like [Oncorhynchus tshawytscha]|uniref:nuclear pore complex protein Nup160-like n=1 Tax=Oncorhynchus tshawytscha TaxID=74940 RepID=UPI001C3D1937|nr:nuclear pore complex protein Nup160-like [Oncorhynchus tshawytscha]
MLFLAVWYTQTEQEAFTMREVEHSCPSLATDSYTGQWNQVFVQPGPEEEVHIGTDQDPRETYLDMLFSPLRFTASAIVKALQIYRRGTERITDPQTLKKELTVTVEGELQNSDRV